MGKKSSKRYQIVRDYLFKICDRGHHSLYKLELLLSPEELYEKKIPDDAKAVEFNEWDRHLEGEGRANTAALIRRDILVYRAVEGIIEREKVPLARESDELKPDAIEILEKNWPPILKGEIISRDYIREIYRHYAPIFRFTEHENTELSFPLRDAAAYALREMKVLANWYPNIPEGICRDIHDILELPSENAIESEIEIYQGIRKNAFGVKFTRPYKLRQVGVGAFNSRSENKPEKIAIAMKKASAIYDIDLSRLVEIYYHYRLIEAAENGQDAFKVYDQLSDHRLQNGGFIDRLKLAKS